MNLNTNAFVLISLLSLGRSCLGRAVFFRIQGRLPFVDSLNMFKTFLAARTVLAQIAQNAADDEGG